MKSSNAQALPFFDSLTFTEARRDPSPTLAASSANMRTTARTATVRIVSILGAFALLGGCATITPQPITDAEVRSRVDSDQMKLYVEQEQVFRPISFEEAVARSLKYNLDYRLKLMESALSSGIADLSKYDMLPNLLVSAGYASRNNITGSRSFQIVDGKEVESGQTYSGGMEKQREIAGAEFSWNLLDFGVSYYRAKQQSDQYLIAEERRRRVIQNILQDVRSAYWRAVGAQRLARDAEALSERAQTALERSREAEAQGLLPPKEALTFQRLLIDAVSLLASRRQELEFAKRELAALMNVTPGTEFTVVEASEPPLMPAPYNVAELEELALTNRPELREEDLRVRISAADARRQLISILPGISLNFGGQYDSNKYLYNNDWIDSGVRIGFNLLKAISIPAMRDVHAAQQKADEARRLALSMAVLTQVRVSVERYRLALKDLEVARESAQIDQRLASYAKAAASARADSELELIRAETRALNSEYQRYSAYAAAQTAYGRIYNSVGLEVVPAHIQGETVAELAKTVAQNVAEIEKDAFPQIAATAKELPAVQLVINAPGGVMNTSAVRKSIEKALARNDISVVDKREGAALLTLTLAQEPAKGGVRRASWEISLRRPDGRQAGTAKYVSTLPEQGNERTMTTFAESAVIANIRQFQGWLNNEESK